MSAAVTSTELATTDRLAAPLTGLEPDSATTLRSAFEEMFAQADEWAARAKLIKVTSVDQKREMKLARESRLALREIRVNAEHARKRLKEDSTRRGKAIDGLANVLKALIEPIEEHLLEQETFALRIDKQRKDELKAAREDALRAYGADPSVYANLGETSEETWALTLEAAKGAHEAKLEAAKQAEAVRVEAERIAAENREKDRAAKAKAEAERVERERLQAEENERLKKEAVEAQRVHKEREDAAFAEREAIKAAAEKARVEATEKQAAVVRELAGERKLASDRVEAEAKKEAAEKAAREAAEVAPDRVKFAAVATSLRAVPVWNAHSEKGKAAMTRVREQIEKLASWIEKTGASL